MKKNKLETPDWLDDRAVEVFEALVEEIGEQLISTDTSILADFAQAQSDIESLTEQIRFEGESLFSDKGNAYVNPRCNLLMARRKDLERYRRDLGLTPKSRGVNIKPIKKSRLASAMEGNE